MAYYIAIRKIGEDIATVDYTYGDPEDQVGKIRLDKATGQSILLEPAPNDTDHYLYKCAAFKLWKHWEAGETPDKTCYAA